MGHGALNARAKAMGVTRLGSLVAGLLLAATAALPAQAQPLPLRGITLVDHTGQRLQARSFAGQLTLMHFVFTGCSTVCPVQTRELVQLRQALPAELRQRVQFLSISVDPLNDTPATLRAFAERMQAQDPGWRFVTGAPAQVEALSERMRVFPPQQPGTARTTPKPEEHRTSIYLYDAQGALVQRFAGVPVDRVRLADEMTRLARLPQR